MGNLVAAVAAALLLALLAAPATASAATAGDTVRVYRMYNAVTSEHLYTTSLAEYSMCGSGPYRDWRAEGVAWRAPADRGTPVMRLYNVRSGDHHYTTSAVERDALVALGDWRAEGVAFLSATASDEGSYPIWRVYNGRLRRGQHHYTRAAGERDALVASHGWRAEGLGFRGVRVWVEDSPAWDEQVQVGERIVCSDGTEWGSEDAAWAHMEEEALAGKSVSYSVQPNYETVHHDATGHWE